MRYFTKTYRLRLDSVVRCVKIIQTQLGTYNRAKVGRDRRGRVMLVNVSGQLAGDGTYVLSLRFRRGGTPWLHIPFFGRHQLYQFADHKKLMRVLANCRVR